MLTVLLISIILLALAMVFMGVNILFRKNGKFPEHSVGHNKNMRKMGITCVKHEEIRNHKKSMNEECCGCKGFC